MPETDEEDMDGLPMCLGGKFELFVRQLAIDRGACVKEHVIAGLLLFTLEIGSQLRQPGFIRDWAAPDFGLDHITLPLMDHDDV